ncbi:MAG: HEAT repeat domain-containing protein, partial [Planctomycetales bacterium]
AVMAPGAVEGVKLLCDMLEHKHRDIRGTAAVALGNLQPPSPEAIDSLRAAVNDSHDSVRQRAVEALKKLGISPS